MDDLMYAVAGAPWGEVGAIELGGTVYLCVHLQDRAGDIDAQHNSRFEGSYKIYSLTNGKLTQVQSALYRLIGFGNAPWPSTKGLSGSASITRNGQTQSVDLAGFQSWLNSWSWKARALTY